MPCRLYLITPPAFEPEAFLPILQQALDGGDVACVQLRLKHADGAARPRDTVRHAAQILMAEVQNREVAFIINDDPELAAELAADGVHVGQDDLSVQAARAIVGPDAIVGVTCHDSRHLAMEAADNGADYVAFGAFYPTATKAAKTRADLETLNTWSAMTTVPCVAIGGIHIENAPPLIDAGANFLAVSAGVWHHPKGPGHAVAAFNRIFSLPATLK